MINLIQGFNISSPLPIDGRILLSRAEMASIDDNIMPDRYFCICEEDGLLYLYDKTAEVSELGRFHKAVPEKTSQIENDGNGDLDSEGNADKFDTISSVDSKIETLDKKVSDNFIDNNELVTALEPYSLKVATGRSLKLESDTSTHTYTIKLLNDVGTVLGDPVVIDLPVESLVMNVAYDSATQSIIITLENGTQTSVPIGSLINGLVNESTFNAHTGNTTVHTNAAEKSNWNAKYDKPADGIPLNDLSSGVKASLAKADESISADYLGSHRYINTYEFPNYVVAGENVFIDQENGKNIISAKDTTYMAGRGIRISSGSDGGEDSHSSVLYISTNSSNPTWTDIDTTSEVGPMDNEFLAALFNAKQDKISDGTTISADSVVDTNSTHKFVSTAEKNTWNAKQNAISASNKISADHVDDTSTTHKFVSSTEKSTWNGKQDKITSTNLLSYSLVEGLSTVAHSGSYTDLSDKPTLSTVAATGAYSDLTGKPSINNGTLTIGVSLGAPEAISTGNTFTANQSGNTTVSIKVPDNTNQLVNGANFQSATQVSSAISTHNSSTSAHSDIRDLITGTNGVSAKISAIEGKIPSAASTTNQLADKEYVNSSISTSTARFTKTVTASADTEAAAQTALGTITGMDDNDYAFVQCTDSSGNTKYKRYKYNGSAWTYEYALNNSSFTAAQWSTINSGITSAMLPTGSSAPSSTNKIATASDISTLNTAISGKQATLVSGTNIKTINSSSILGSGNLNVGTVTGVSVVGTTPIIVEQASGHTATSPKYSITHATSLSSAQGFGPSSAATLSPGSSFNVPNVTFNTYGHITSGANRQITIPGIATDRGLAVISNNQVGIKTVQITIPADATWTAAAGTAGQIGYYYTYSTGTDGVLAHITANSQPVLDVDMSAVADADEIDAINEAWSKIYRAVTETRAIKFYSTEQLTTALTINVKG